MFDRNPSIRCKFLSSSLKDTFSKCPLFPGKLSGSSSEEGEAVIGFDEEDEVSDMITIALYFHVEFYTFFFFLSFFLAN